MDKNAHIAYWLSSADKDSATMAYLQQGKMYVHALFFAHLYLEKISKALWVKNNAENYPPRIHNLLTILKQANAVISEEQQLFLLKLNQFQIEGRYPEDVENLYKFTDKELTTSYISTTKTIAACLLEQLP